MNFAKWPANKFVGIFVLIVCFTGFVGCAGTIAVKPVIDNTASYDGNEKNSGIKEYIEGKGFVVTPHFRDRYNNLIEKYGKKFENPIKKDDGLVNFGADYLINKQHMIYFVQMNTWHKSGVSP